MQYKILTASGLLHTGNCEFYGGVVTLHSSGTIKVIDGVTAGGGRVILDTITLASGVPQTITMPAPASCVNGLYVVIGGTGSFTFSYN